MLHRQLNSTPFSYLFPLFFILTINISALFSAQLEGNVWMDNGCLGGPVGCPIAGATIIASGGQNENTTDVYTTTNESGHYVLELPSGNYFVICAREGWVTQEISLYVNEDGTEHDFYLPENEVIPPSVFFSGHVYGNMGPMLPAFEHIAGAHVKLYGGFTGGFLAETETNVNGYFEFDDVVMSAQSYFIEAEGYLPIEGNIWGFCNSIDPIIDECFPIYADFYLELENTEPTTAVLFGHVTAQMSPMGPVFPIAGATVSVLTSSVWDTVLETETNEDGYYELEVVLFLDGEDWSQINTYEIIAISEYGTQVQTVTLEANHETELNFHFNNFDNQNPAPHDLTVEFEPMPLGGLVYLNWQYEDANTDPFQSDGGFHIYVYYGWDDMEWSLIGESTTTSFDYILGDFWWPEELCFKVTAVHNGEESEPSNIACAWDDPNPDPECEDLGDFNFGDCEMVIGIGFNGNECTWFSGCGTMDEDGIDYADSFFDSIDECVEFCGQGNDDDGPPECLMDCEGIFDIDPDVDPEATCVWLIETLNSDIECTTDCDDETLGFLMEVSSLCEQCLDGAFDCADIFDDGDDEGGDEYGHLNGYVEYVWGDAIEMVAGAQILIQSISPDGTMIDVYETTTNDWGQYEIELPTGGYMVTASAYDDSETHVVYIEGGQEHVLTFQLGEFYYPDIYALSGMVNGSDGPNDDYYPLPGAQIRAECISTGEVYETNAGEVGYYWLYLPFPDAYSVTVSHDGYQATTQIFEVTGIVEANFFLNSQGGVEAEAILSLGDGYGGPEGFTVPLYLNSSQSVSGLQFAVWPMLETWDYYFIPGEVEVLNDCFTGDGNDVYGQLWGIIFSLEGCVYEPGQDHHVANLSFTVEGDVPAGTQVPLVFNYTLVSDSDANEIPSMGEGSMVTFGQLGDVNGDGAINVVDIVNMVNFALQSDEPTAYEAWASDLNEDGEINVLDIVSVINIILYGDDLLRSDSGDAEIYLGSAQVQVVGHDISGIQLTFDDMVNLREVSLPHGWTMNTHENTLIAYTLEGKVLNGRALFQLNQSAELIGVLIADANGEAVSASINVLPSTVTLKGNYPNPFNPETTIQYEIVWDAMVSLSVYDITGRLVEILVNTNQYAGQHSILWTAQDEPSGMYIIRLVVDGESFTRKMMLMK